MWHQPKHVPGLVADAGDARHRPVGIALLAHSPVPAAVAENNLVILLDPPQSGLVGVVAPGAVRYGHPQHLSPLDPGKMRQAIGLHADVHPLAPELKAIVS